MARAMTNGMAIKLSLLGFTALASLAVHQAMRTPQPTQESASLAQR